MSDWVQATIDRIHNKPHEFIYADEGKTSCYYTRFNDLRVKVYRTGFLATFNGIGRWESVDHNYYQDLFDHNNDLLNQKLATYEELR